MGSAEGKGGEGGPGPPSREEDKQSTSSNMKQEEGKDVLGVMKKSQCAQSEHLQEGFL
jgi:hypothetical protein